MSNHAQMERLESLAELRMALKAKKSLAAAEQKALRQKIDGFKKNPKRLAAVLKQHRKHLAAAAAVLLLMLALPSLSIAQLPAPPVMPELPVSVQRPILPATPGERAALDRWRENFEARPSCAKCGLVCDCGDCRCEAAKAKSDKVGFQYAAAPANCPDGRCRPQVAATRRQTPQPAVRYVPQPAMRTQAAPCQSCQPQRGRFLPRLLGR